MSVVNESSGTLDAQATGVDEPHGAAAGAGTVWVASGGGGLAKIDAQTHTVEQTIPVGEGPEGVAVSG